MKKQISVVPLKKVGSIEFGMLRTAVRDILGAEFKEFRKSRFSANTTDDFGFAHVYYDAKDACIAVELFDECTVSVGDSCVMPCDPQSFSSWLKSADGQADVQDGEATSVALSIGATFADGKVESVLFARPGYYA